MTERDIYQRELLHARAAATVFSLLSYAMEVTDHDLIEDCVTWINSHGGRLIREPVAHGMFDALAEARELLDCDADEWKVVLGAVLHAGGRQTTHGMKQ